MSKPDLGRIIAQTMAKPAESRTIETITNEILDAKRTGGEAILFRLRRKYLSKWAFAADGLLIRPAASQQDLTDEGNRLHHCVSTYGKRHAEGESAIFFIRRKNRPGEELALRRRQ